MVQLLQENNTKLLDILNKFNCLEDIQNTTTYKRLTNPNLIKDFNPPGKPRKKSQLFNSISFPDSPHSDENQDLFKSESGIFIIYNSFIKKYS